MNGNYLYIALLVTEFYQPSSELKTVYFRGADKLM